LTPRSLQYLGGFEYEQNSLPSDSGLAIELGRYCSPAWRGINPDRRKPSERPPPPGFEWDDDLRADLIGGISMYRSLICQASATGEEFHSMLEMLVQKVKIQFKRETVY
jgi:hypothetical protein